MQMEIKLFPRFQLLTTDGYNAVNIELVGRNYESNLIAFVKLDSYNEKNNDYICRLKHSFKRATDAGRSTAHHHRQVDFRTDVVFSSK